MFKMNLTREDLKKVSGEDLARLINITNMSIEEGKELKSICPVETDFNRWDCEIEEWTELLGALTEEYIDRKRNGGDLEGYEETLMIIDYD